MCNKKLLEEKKQRKMIHSIERCKERYGIELSEIDYRRITNSIRFLGKPYKKRYYEVELIKKVSCTRTIYLVKYNNTNLTCVYNKDKECIESILPNKSKEFLEYLKQKEGGNNVL
jgi:hypothetical protein